MLEFILDNNWEELVASEQRRREEEEAFPAIKLLRETYADFIGIDDLLSQLIKIIKSETDCEKSFCQFFLFFNIFLSLYVLEHYDPSSQEALHYKFNTASAFSTNVAHCS